MTQQFNDIEEIRKKVKAQILSDFDPKNCNAVDTTIKETKTDWYLATKNENLEYSMTFGVTKRAKKIVIMSYLLLTTIISLLFFNSDIKIDNENIMGYLLMLGISLMILIHYLFFNRSSVEKIILTKDGIKLHDYPITLWSDIIDSFIITKSDGENNSYIFVIALTKGIYREQPIFEDGTKLGHYVEEYKKLLVLIE